MVFALIETCLNLSWFVLILNYDYKEIKLTSKLCFNMMAISSFPLLVLSYKAGILTMYTYYFLIPLGNFVFYSVKSTMKWVVYTTFLIIASIIISYYVDTGYTYKREHLYIFSIMNISVFISMLFFFYLSFTGFLSKRDDIIRKIVNNNQQETVSKKNNQAHGVQNENMPAVADDESREKYKKLYGEIIAYFEKQRPYTSSDFRISFLADELNSNTTYISNSINEFSGLNFSSLVNRYRIEYVKQLIREGYLDRYSMTYVYTKAGFKYQSTFNEIFKKIEKLTPREYVKKLQT
jgi:AraC-like DNA-binding protein